MPAMGYYPTISSQKHHQLDRLDHYYFAVKKRRLTDAPAVLHGSNCREYDLQKGITRHSNPRAPPHPVGRQITQMLKLFFRDALYAASRNKPHKQIGQIIRKGGPPPACLIGAQIQGRSSRLKVSDDKPQITSVSPGGHRNRIWPMADRQGLRHRLPILRA